MHVIQHVCSTFAEAKGLLRVMVLLLVSSCRVPMAGIGPRVAMGTDQESISKQAS
jgi:hypothetical protein